MIFRKVSLAILGILATWLLAGQAAGSPSSAVPLTPRERQWLHEHPVIRLAPDPDFRPIEYFDKDGVYRGAAADIVRLVEEKLGLKITIVRLKNWDEVMEKFRRREVDLLGAIVKTPDREKFALFSDTLVAVPGGIFTRDPVTREMTLDDLKGKKVAVVSNYTAHDVLENLHPDLLLDVVPDVSTGLAKASLGMVDAYVENMASATFYSQEAGITNLRLAGKTNFDYRWAIGIRKDWPELQGILNKGIAAVGEEGRKAALGRWISVRNVGWRPDTTFIVAFVASILGLLLAVSGVWNRSLRRAKAALQESEKRFRSLVENAGDAFFVHDTEGRFLDVNQRACEVLGYPREKLLTMRATDVEVEVPSEVLHRHWTRAVPGEFLTSEGRERRQDGTTFPVEARSASIERNGEKHIIVLVRDITERKRAEEDLRRNLEVNVALAALYKPLTSPRTDIRGIAAAVLDQAIQLTRSSSGYISEIDPASGDNVMHTLTEMVQGQCDVRGADRRTVFPRKPDGTYPGVWGYSLNTKEPFRTDAPGSHPASTGLPAGHIPLERFLSMPVLLGSELVGQIAVANSTLDYTEHDVRALEKIAEFYALAIQRNRADAEKDRLQSELQQAMKMEAVGRLAGGVAHDFNNLLTAIIGNVALARMKLPASDAVADMLVEANKAAERAASLIQQLLAFSRKQIIEPRVLNLEDMVDEVHAMLVRLIGEDIELKTIARSPSGSVKVDPGQFQQILVNLVVNARDAMPRGGQIVIETSQADLDDGYCSRHPYVKPGRFAMLSVSDTGQGMTEEVKAHVFEPFFTTKAVGSGTGLGLATAYGAVKQAGGSIEVCSEVGKGTTFRICLPAVEEEASKREAVEGSTELPGGRETVLFVEDEEVVRGLGIRVLEQLGYKVLHAPGGPEAIALSGSYDGRIDLLVTDVVMPGMNGRELAQHFLEVRPEMKVLYTSGYTERAVAHHEVLEEGLAFLSKPYPLSSLAKKIREVLDGAMR